MTTQTPANRNVSHSLPPKQHVRRSARQGKTAGERALAAAADDETIRYTIFWYNLTNGNVFYQSITRDLQQKHKEKINLLSGGYYLLGNYGV